MFSKYVWQNKMFEILIYIIFFWYFPLALPCFHADTPIWVYCLGERDEMEQKAGITLKLLFLKA